MESQTMCICLKAASSNPRLDTGRFGDRDTVRCAPSLEIRVSRWCSSFCWRQHGTLQLYTYLGCTAQVRVYSFRRFTQVGHSSFLAGIHVYIGNLQVHIPGALVRAYTLWELPHLLIPRFEAEIRVYTLWQL